MSEPPSGIRKRSFGNDRRAVLFPFGQPVVDKHRGACEALIIRAGGDQQRFIDPLGSDLQRFVRYVRRIPRALQPPPFVVLTRTNPLALTVVQPRRELTRAIPVLADARWLIYLAPDEDPFFLGSAEALGTLTAPLHQAPVWDGPDGYRFAVLSSCVIDPSAVDSAMRLLDEAPAARACPFGPEAPPITQKTLRGLAPAMRVAVS